MLKNQFFVIGLMSGTSLDGVDLAFCEFNFNKTWSFRLLNAVTIPYDLKWKNKLEEIHHGTALEISELDCAYGIFLGNLVKEYSEKWKRVPDFISSHGHTVFHQPQKGFSKQIGSGAHLSVASGFPVICDFRSADVALGGQGAPLVPVGDKFLFPEMDYCLNLGGIANISFEKNNERLAYDICACNMVLNHYAGKRNLSFDENGKLAAAGKINETLLQELKNIPYYKKPFPKSLGREEVENELLPLIDKFTLNVEDASATFCEHVAEQISIAVGQENKNKKMLLTGGGTYHSFLVKKITEKTNAHVLIPDKEIIEYKEAIIFSFLGILRMRREINCLRSVTGARSDSCTGAVFQPLVQV